MKKIRVGIVGASGYGAGELLRILERHPLAQVVSAVSSSAEGSTIEELHPHITGANGKICCTKEIDISQFSDPNTHCCIFVALPHGHSGSFALSLFRNPSLQHVRIVDLSGDLRFKTQSLAKTWYPETEFLVEERAQVAYGIPEINSEHLRQSRLIANPGCLASAAIYALAPLRSPLFNANIIIDAKTGTSGAGRTPQAAFHHPSMHANCNAYKILEHRHEAEIREALGDPAGERFKTDFVPMVIPTSRGIYASSYILCQSLPDEQSIIDQYQVFYQKCPFIKITTQPPELRNVVGSNYCHLYLKKRGSTLFVASIIDNLIKGMAGNAIQNMNISMGIEETAGLLDAGMGIV